MELGEAFLSTPKPVSFQLQNPKKIFCQRPHTHTHTSIVYLYVYILIIIYIFTCVCIYNHFCWLGEALLYNSDDHPELIIVYRNLDSHKGSCLMVSKHTKRSKKHSLMILSMLFGETVIVATPIFLYHMWLYTFNCFSQDQTRKDTSVVKPGLPCPSVHTFRCFSLVSVQSSLCSP